MSDRVNVYEGMFLVAPAEAGNLKGIVDHIQDLLGRAEAEIIAMRKWDERRLAYEIRGNKRGVYFLTYFRAPGGQMEELDRNCNLSEQILRAMFTRADHIPMDQMEASDARQTLDDEMKVRSEQDAETAAASGAEA